MNHLTETHPAATPRPSATTHPAATGRTRRRWPLLLLAAPVLVFVLAGCAPTAAPTTNAGTGAGQPGSDSEFSAARDAYDLKLAQCLRGHGLEVKDPLPGQGITEDAPEIREAYPLCTSEIGDPPARPDIQLSTEDLDKLLERAKCLREKGYEIQEPTAGDPGFIPAEVSDADFETCRTS